VTGSITRTVRSMQAFRESVLTFEQETSHHDSNIEHVNDSEGSASRGLPAALYCSSSYLVVII
jgi:hypothetical protein